MLRSKFKDHWAVKLLAYLCFVAIVGSTLLAIVSSRYGWPMLLELASHFSVSIFRVFAGAAGFAAANSATQADFDKLAVYLTISAANSALVSS